MLKDEKEENQLRRLTVNVAVINDTKMIDFEERISRQIGCWSV